MNRRSLLTWATASAIVVAVLAIALGTTGCALFGGAVSPVEMPTEPVGVIGEVKSIDETYRILVEGGVQPPGAASDKAMVTIDDETLIARDGRWIPPDELAVGMTVRVWFEGAVAESYPVQGTARFIYVE